MVVRQEREFDVLVDYGHINNIIGVFAYCGQALYAMTVLWVHSETVKRFVAIKFIRAGSFRPPAFAACCYLVRVSAT